MSNAIIDLSILKNNILCLFLHVQIEQLYTILQLIHVAIDSFR